MNIRSSTEKVKDKTTTRVNCPFCNLDDYTFIAKEFKKTEIVKCNGCNLMYTNPRISDPGSFYHGSEEYYLEEAKLIFEKKKVSHRWPNYLNDVKLLKEHKKSGKLLDIGSNYGFFSMLTREHGFTPTCVEPSKTLAKIAKDKFNLNVQNCFLDEFKTKEKFDVITLTDVFEHITEPKEMLQQCRTLLNDEGIIFIKVPNGKFQLLKEKLLRKGDENRDIWDSYEHVVHYTQDTFRKMVEGEGFKITQFDVDPPVQLPNWHEHIGKYYQYPTPWYMDIKKKIARRSFYIVSRILFSITKKIPVTAQAMSIIARKN